MNIVELYEIHKDKKNSEQLSNKWLLAFLRLTFFTKGIKPNYRLPADRITGTFSHSRYDEDAEKYEEILRNEIFTRYPYDSEITSQLRRSLANTDAIKDLLDRFFQELTSVLFQGNNFEIQTDNPKLLNWMQSENFKVFSKNNLLREFLFNDPNAYILITDGHTEEFGKNVEAIPKIIIIPSSEILKITDDFIIYKGGVIGKNENYNAKTNLVYKHGLNELPARQLGGIMVDNYYYESFIGSVFGPASKYIQDQCDAEIELKTIATRFELIEPTCPTCGGGGKSIKKVENNCETCFGRGSIVLNLGSVVTYPEAKTNGGDSIANVKRFNYTQANTDYYKELSLRMESEYEQAEQKLGLYSIKGNQAKSAEFLVELKNQRSLIFQNIGSHYELLIDFIVQNVAKILNQTGEQVYSIIIPTKYDLTTVQDILLQLEMEKKNSMPSSVINRTEIAYIRKLYGTETYEEREIEFLQLYDVLHGIGDNTILSGYSNEQLAIHKLLKFYLKKWVYKNGNQMFMQTDFDKLFNEIYEQIKPEIESMPII